MLKVARVEVVGEELQVTVQSDSGDEVVSSEATKMAYAERIKHGFAEAGIGGSTGPYPIDKTKDLASQNEADYTKLAGADRAKLAYCNTFTLRRGIR